MDSMVCRSFFSFTSIVLHSQLSCSICTDFHLYSAFYTSVYLKFLFIEVDNTAALLWLHIWQVNSRICEFNIVSADLFFILSDVDIANFSDDNTPYLYAADVKDKSFNTFVQMISVYSTFVQMI